MPNQLDQPQRKSYIGKFVHGIVLLINVVASQNLPLEVRLNEA